MKKTYKKLLHLYSRAGFGIDKKNADELITNKDWISSLVYPKEIKDLTYDLPDKPDAPYNKMDADDRMSMRKQMRQFSREINIKWIDEMAHGDNVLVEKMTLFWHGHFACRIVDPYKSLQYTNVIRKNGLGNFKNLVLEVSKSSAMIDYLHLKQNRKRKPNEDFARELCELFTLGRDTVYTESDVKEIARCFTGWNYKQKTLQYRFIPKQHDTGEKTIFNKTGTYSGEDVIKMITSQKECAKFISKKIYAYFVNPIPNEKHINLIADKFYNSDYDIAETMAFIFNANWFYADENIGAKIKSPIELLVSLKKSFGLNPVNEQSWIILQKNLDQELFNPPNVAGWPGNRDWIDSSRLAMRLRLPSILLNNGDIPIAYKENYDEDPNDNRNKKQMKYIRKFKCAIDWNSIEETHQEDVKKCTLEELLIRGELSSSAQNYLKANAYDGFKERVIQIISLPEYQLC
ncbi:DUF1800 domain-containing protein [Flammeovirga kamogawensis]|uniref:DUF1800 domain-containing protein n=1 Tax=Flammeovirga kamogawensis TaxID=373891 RepID=A0ABX8GVB7_9BACT|nr:DUF1800 domain-containing protein [Flammeovirga kamogawensis]MBB6459581.1 uncharacterized protein (DUF1800 family) [Flammeovirga kamogawensis]QWG07354.1 DUF1800 domain-containing protein [Flammeovirga kamogawensis]TRX69171.1 DUF1800 domain-containing protein [Flammeovirga kamogawensis]